MNLLTTLFRQPIVHFLFLALPIFWLSRPEFEPSQKKKVEVSQARFYEFLQYRAKSFDTPRVLEQFSNLSQEQRQQLVTQFIKEDVLYKKALELSLDDNDYVIKQRLIQKVEYLLQKQELADITPTETQLVAHYQNHIDEYEEPVKITFTHVFVEAEHTNDVELNLLLEHLNSNDVNFSQATLFGDAFLYHRNYIQRSMAMVKSHFGDDFVRHLIALPPSDSKWYGPIRSEHGFHIVMLTDYSPARVLALEEVRSRVTNEVKLALQKQQQQLAITELFNEFEIVYMDNMQQLIEPNLIQELSAP